MEDIFWRDDFFTRRRQCQT